MPTRYYVVPVVVSETGEVEPKYLNLMLGEKTGLIGPELPSRDSREFREPYYVVKITAKDEAEFVEFDKMSDAINVTSTEILGKVSELEEIGVDLTTATSVEDMEKSVVEWLTGRTGFSFTTIPDFAANPHKDE